MGLFSKDEKDKKDVETVETVETTEDVKVVKDVSDAPDAPKEPKEPKKRKRSPKTTKSDNSDKSDKATKTAKTTKNTKRAPNRKTPVTTSAPSAKAATTHAEFTRIMAIYRNQCIPARFSKNNVDKYITPLQGNYQNDILDPYEIKGIDYWVTELDYATRYPVNTDYTFTATGATVDKTDDDFIITLTAETATLGLDQTAPDSGWHVFTADVSGRAKWTASFDVTDVDVELTPRIKGKLRFCSFTDNTGQALSFTVQGKIGEVIKLSNVQFYRIAHNIA